MNLLKSVTPKGWVTNNAERKSYYSYFLGQNVIYNLVAAFLTTYLMFTGVDLKKIATIMLAVKVWDAVNDAVFGVIFDSVKFKSGKKYLPWLRISLALIPMTTIVMFAIPSGISENMKLIWFAVGYILWDTAYTLCDVPIYGVITAMTQNLDERNGLMSYKSIWAGGGNVIATVVATVLVSEKIGSNYTVVAIVCGIVALISMAPACFKIEERFVAETEEQFTVRRMFAYLFKNKYLLNYYGGYFFYSSGNVSAALNLFASYYLFHNSMFSLVVGALGVAPSLIFSLLIPKMLRKIDKMRLYRVCLLTSIVLSVAMWLVGYQSMVLFIVFSTLRAIPLAIVGSMNFMFTPDCAEYGKFTSGIEANGITFAIQTFMAKLTGAVSGALGMFILGLKSTGWINVEVENFEQLEALGVVQPPQALDTLWFVYVMVPAIGYILAYLIWRFYKLNDKDVQIMADCNAGKISREEAEQKLSRNYY